MKDKLRIVIDPNLLASVLIGGQTRYQFIQIIDLADKIDICYADELLEEVKALPTHPYFQQKGIKDTVVDDFIHQFTGLSLKVFVTSSVKVGRDANDFYLLSLYRGSQADYLLTGDPDLLILDRYGLTKITYFSYYYLVFPPFCFCPFGYLLISNLKPVNYNQSHTLPLIFFIAYLPLQKRPTPSASRPQLPVYQETGLSARTGPFSYCTTAPWLPPFWLLCFCVC